jgi:hypothetical protein
VKGAVEWPPHVECGAVTGPQGSTEPSHSTSRMRSCELRIFKMPLQNRPRRCDFRLDCSRDFYGQPGRGASKLQTRNRPSIHQPALDYFLLEFKGRRRSVMSPGSYTELFVLDEAVALAAGHRPCAECRRERFNVFKNAWRRSGGSSRELLRAPEIDGELHRARIDRRRGKVTYDAPLSSLRTVVS